MELLKILTIVLFSIFLLVLNLSAQGPDTLWVRKYGGLDMDEAHSVQQTSDGGYIIVGMTKPFGVVKTLNVYLIKTDANGDTIWTKMYGGSNYDAGYSVQQTTDGGYIIAGMTSSFGVDSGDVYLIKTNSFGDTLWTKTYGGVNFDCGYSVQQTSDGGYIIAGRTGSFGAGNDDVYLIKTDTNGDTLWTKTYGGQGRDIGYSVQQTSDGGYIVAGYTESFGPGYCNVYLLKTDSLGSLTWSNFYGGQGTDYARSVCETSDGKYVVVGTKSGSSSYEVYLIKTYSNGDTVWTKTYGDIRTDYGYSVQETVDGGYIIAGMSYVYGSNTQHDVYLVRTDKNGDTLWTETYGEEGWQEAHSVRETSDGGYIAAGITFIHGIENMDFYVVKTAPDPVGVEEKQDPRPPVVNIRLLFHPNPFTSEVRIQTTEDRKGNSDICFPTSDLYLEIYDVSGRLVKKLSLPTAYSVLPTGGTWDGRDEKGKELQSGIYFLKLNGKPAGKVVKVK
ncbi:hypothetical protein KAX75_02795 [candidate division WOR-3 bacterium]|nr:hypothetical protein [candidate division WOR-3 bacterium]